MDGRVFYEPHDRQNQFHLATARNVLYGGAAGGGKSVALRMDALMRCLAIPGYRALLLRRTFPELRNTHIDKLMVEVKQLGGEYLKSENTARFPNGSMLECGHCEDETAVIKYLSTEYTAIYPDELVTFTETQIKFLMSRLRSTLPGVTPIFRAASNPGGANSYWVKRYYILKDISPAEDPAYDPADYHFIPATLDDNAYLDKAEYDRRLMALPSDALRRAYRYGDWDVFEGQYFSEWRQTDEEGSPWHVIHELPEYKGRSLLEQPWLEVFRALDWGYREPGVCGWYACLPDGTLIKFKEFVFREMLAKDVAKEIRRHSEGLKIRYTVADPSIWLKTGATAESIAETLARHKVPCIEGENDRIQGWHRLHSWLQETTGEPTRPILQIYAPGCPYTVRTIPQMIIDPNRPEDVKTKETEDHAADETRYAVMSRPAPSKIRYKSTGEVNPTFGLTADGMRLLREAKRKQRRGWMEAWA